MLGNTINNNGLYGIVGVVLRTGFGNNVLYGNNGGGQQVGGIAFPASPELLHVRCVLGAPLRTTDRETRDLLHFMGGHECRARRASTFIPLE